MGPLLLGIHDDLHTRLYGTA